MVRHDVEICYEIEQVKSITTRLRPGCERIHKLDPYPSHPGTSNRMTFILTPPMATGRLSDTGS